MKQTIQDYKKDAILNKVLRYEEGIMSRRQWLKMMQVKGAFVEEDTKNRIHFNRTKFNRMTEGQEEYERKCNEKVLCYNLKLPGEPAYWEITKTEYEHFKALQLAEDVNTQKNEIPEKIEAGTATEEEVNEYMQQDFDYFSKYAN